MESNVGFQNIIQVCVFYSIHPLLIFFHNQPSFKSSLNVPITHPSPLLIPLTPLTYSPPFTPLTPSTPLPIPLPPPFSFSDKRCSENEYSSNLSHFWKLMLNSFFSAHSALASEKCLEPLKYPPPPPFSTYARHE